MKLIKSPQLRRGLLGISNIIKKIYTRRKCTPELVHGCATGFFLFFYWWHECTVRYEFGLTVLAGPTALSWRKNKDSCPFRPSSPSWAVCSCVCLSVHRGLCLEMYLEGWLIHQLESYEQPTRELSREGVIRNPEDKEWGFSALMRTGSVADSAPAFQKHLYFNKRLH